MVDLVQTLPCSFRGVKFFMESSQLIVGRKVIPFEFVNKTARFSQDVGGLLRTYEIKAIITGFNYLSNRKAFIEAINKPGIGIFQHPFDGPVKVVADPATLSEDFRRFGELEINVIFRESRGEIYPKEAADNRSFINKLTGDALAATQAAVDDLFALTAGFRENYEDAIETMNNISNIVNTVTLPFSAVSELISDFSTTAANFKNNITRAIQAPGQTAANIRGLFQSLNNLVPNATERYNLNKQVFRAGVNQPLFIPTPATVKSTQRVQNRTALYSQVNFNILAYAYLAASQMSFNTEEEVLSIAQEMEDQYEYTIDLTPFSEEYLLPIKQLRDQMRIFLESNRVNVNTLTPYNAKHEPITTLCYRFYDNLDNDTLLLNINDISTPNNVNGDIALVTTA